MKPSSEEDSLTFRQVDGLQGSPEVNTRWAFVPPVDGWKMLTRLGKNE